MTTAAKPSNDPDPFADKAAYLVPCPEPSRHTGAGVLGTHNIEQIAGLHGCDPAVIGEWWAEFVKDRLPGSPVEQRQLSLRRTKTPSQEQHTLSDQHAVKHQPPLSMRDQAVWLNSLKDHAKQGPDPKATERQHDRGKLTVRERLNVLLDPDSFVELDLFARHRASGFGLEHNRPLTDGVVTGWGTVYGRKVFVFAHDFRIFGGSLGEVHAAKVHKVIDMAEAVGAPVIGLNDGAGARIQEGVTALAGYGGIFRRNVRASGVIPQISVILGPCAGGAVYSPALTDFVFMVEGIANMYITGPDVIAAVTGERVTHEELGGAFTHATKSGVASFVASNEKECLEQVRYLLSFLPSNNLDSPPHYTPTDDPERRCEELFDIVPSGTKQVYDVRGVITAVVDDGDFLEVLPQWATNLVCGFARIDGYTIGVVANQPQVLAGSLDINASEKGARFVRTCDAFNVPLVTLVDVPGFLPGTSQEFGGIIRHGAKLLYAYCDATVPRVQLILRKAFGGAYIVMDSKSIGADLSFAWPSNEIAVMGAEGAINTIFKKEIARAVDSHQHRAELCAEYTDKLMSPFGAAERGLIDDVIDPADTRRVLVRSLAMLRDKREQFPRRKHGREPF